MTALTSTTTPNTATTSTAATNYLPFIHQQCPSRIWINNPTMDELALSVQHGSAGITTNPTYAANQLKRDPEAALPILRQALTESDDDSVVADLVQQRLIARLLPAYQELYQQSAGAFRLCLNSG